MLPGGMLHPDLSEWQHAITSREISKGPERLAIHSSTGTLLHLTCIFGVCTPAPWRSVNLSSASTGHGGLSERGAFAPLGRKGRLRPPWAFMRIGATPQLAALRPDGASEQAHLAARLCPGGNWSHHTIMALGTPGRCRGCFCVNRACRGLMFATCTNPANVLWCFLSDKGEEISRRMVAIAPPRPSSPLIFSFPAPRLL